MLGIQALVYPLTWTVFHGASLLLLAAPLHPRLLGRNPRALCISLIVAAVGLAAIVVVNIFRGGMDAVLKIQAHTVISFISSIACTCLVALQDLVLLFGAGRGVMKTLHKSITPAAWLTNLSIRHALLVAACSGLLAMGTAQVTFSPYGYPSLSIAQSTIAVVGLLGVIILSMLLSTPRLNQITIKIRISTPEIFIVAGTIFHVTTYLLSWISLAPLPHWALLVVTVPVYPLHTIGGMTLGAGAYSILTMSLPVAVQPVVVTALAAGPSILAGSVNTSYWMLFAENHMNDILPRPARVALRVGYCLTMPMLLGVVMWCTNVFSDGEAAVDHDRSARAHVYSNLEVSLAPTDDDTARLVEPDPATLEKALDLMFVAIILAGISLVGVRRQVKNKANKLWGGGPQCQPNADHDACMAAFYTRQRSLIAFTSSSQHLEAVLACLCVLVLPFIITQVGPAAGGAVGVLVGLSTAVVLILSLLVPDDFMPSLMACASALIVAGSISTMSSTVGSLRLFRASSGVILPAAAMVSLHVGILLGDSIQRFIATASAGVESVVFITYGITMACSGLCLMLHPLFYQPQSHERGPIPIAMRNVAAAVRKWRYRAAAKRFGADVGGGMQPDVLLN